MKRQIITIDGDKCNGCGLCVAACHEGAIGMKDGKAVLLRDDYCDGLGNCLPACPTGAITFEEREALPFDEEAVRKNAEEKKRETREQPCGCPGKAARAIGGDHSTARPSVAEIASESRLRQWPVQIRLVPVNAPYFDGAHLLLAADCSAYAHGAFHETFMKDRITLIGCPKLDDVDYAEKLTAILQGNDIRSVTVVRMEVPCCGGLERAAVEALKNCGKMIPWQVVTLSVEGEVLQGR